MCFACVGHVQLVVAAAAAMSAAVAATPTLYIEYCTNCGLAQQFSSLKAALAKANVDVDLVANQAPPRMSPHTTRQRRHARTTARRGRPADSSHALLHLLFHLLCLARSSETFEVIAEDGTVLYSKLVGCEAADGAGDGVATTMAKTLTKEGNVALPYVCACVLCMVQESGCLPNMPQLVSRIQSHLAATASVGLEEAARRQRLRRRQLLAASLSIGVIVAAVGAWGWRTRQAQQQTARVQ